MTASGLVLEAASAPDLDALAELERRCSSHPWTPAQLQEEMSDPGRAWILVLRAPRERDGAGRGIRAFCALRVVADELHVLNMGVRPEDRRRGLARRLLSLALDFAARRGARWALLEVRRSNRPALELYGGLGFETLSVRRAYYREPVEDAVLLRADLGGARSGGVGEDP